jgi:AmpD protein
MRACHAYALSIDAATGLLIGVRQVLSPHADERPPGVQTGATGGAWHQPAARGIRWSMDRPPVHRQPAGGAHPAVGFAADSGPAGVGACGDPARRRDHAVRAVGARAWHAGESSYRGRAACNDFSVGIELEGTDEMAYTDAAVPVAGIG